jgi:tripartite-type tricarboxylate transporter receptor subunit TctC
LASTLPASIAPEVADGSIKALGVFADERSDVLPDVPTMKELGYDVSLPAWLMVFAHKDVPEETQALLESCFLEALATPSAQSMSNRTGADIVPRGREEAGRLYRSTIETVGNVLREIGEID